MFDLEQSVAEWRQQMLAAGIKTPVPLEELESHLREEIERQIKSGMNGSKAFETAVQRIGQAEPLKKEFRNAGFAYCPGEDNNRRSQRIFALLWLAYCTWGFFSLVRAFLTLSHGIILGGRFNPDLWGAFGANHGIRLMPDFLLILLFELIFLRGMIAGILFFDGKTKEIRTIRFIAALGLLAFVAQIFFFKDFFYGGLWYSGAVFAAQIMVFWHAFPLSVASMVFNMASLWLFRSPRQKKEA